MGLMFDWTGAERVRWCRLCCESRLCVGASCTVLSGRVCSVCVCVLVVFVCLFVAVFGSRGIPYRGNEVPSLLLWLLQRGSRVRV